MRTLAFLLVMACLIAPNQAKAASDQVGVYVAPKFIVGIGNFKAKAHETYDGGSESFNLGSKTGTTAGGALAIGYDFNKKFDFPVRLELEYSLMGQFKGTKDQAWDDTEGDRFKTKVNVQSLFVNVYYDFRNSTKFTPYVGGGIGLGFVSTKTDVSGYDVTTGVVSNLPEDHYTVGKKSKTNFAWNLGLGCAYDFTDNFSVDLGYRYASFGKGNTKAYSGDDGSETIKTRNVSVHQFMMGIRYTF